MSEPYPLSCGYGSDCATGKDRVEELDALLDKVAAMS